MNRLITSFNIRFLSFLLLLVIISCKKFVQVPPAPNMIESGQVFSNDKTALSAVLGVYQQMRNSTKIITNGGLSIFAGLSADEIYNTAPNSTDDPFYKNALPANNGTVASFWNNAYSNIYKINACLEGLGKSSAISDSLKIQLTAEMKVVRALYYFYMVNLFGDVPFITSTDYRVNEKMERTQTDLIMKHIAQDVEESKNTLKETYPSANRARVNKWVAASLLARVYLFNGNWALAETEASAIINSGMYSLSSVATVFQPASNETIWQLVSDNTNSYEGSVFNPSSATTKPAYALTAFLLNSFESGDLRKTTWTKANTLNGVQYYYPFKYASKTNTPVNEYPKLLRLAEIYLIRAEAAVQQDKIANAQNDLNTVRTRAGLLNTPATNRAALLLAIEKERFVELFSEFGHRWFDLKRTKRVDAVLSTEKPGWQSTAVLYPIPQSQIELNVFLGQNPGY